MSPGNDRAPSGGVTPSGWQIIPAHAPEYVDGVRSLFREYAGGLGIDLCFQNFEEELKTLPGAYAPPNGALFLAMAAGGSEPAGCVGWRQIEPGIAEMKRLYVRPQFRQKGIGGGLARETIRSARERGYRLMRLDTLSSMAEALALYHSLGFVGIPAYYHNPSDCAVFLELNLE